MSILAAASAENLRGELVFAAACLAVGAAAGALLRRWRPGGSGPAERLGRGEPVWPLVGILMAGLFCWIAIPAAFFSYKHAALVAREGPGARLDPKSLSPGDLAFLSTVPPAAAFVCLLAGDAALRRGAAYRLDLGLRGFASGAGRGALASVCVVPLLFVFMTLLDWVYRWVGFRHPPEHELLRALGESHSLAVTIPLLAGATLAAPLFEELLFRGHLQTVVRRAFVRLAEARARGRAGDVPAIAPPAELPPEATTAAPPAPVAAPPWVTLMSVVVTSMLFTAVHPAWTWPPIFLLALCLGYAYERTGNLWVPIVIHAAFNSASTLLYLSGRAN